MATADRIRDVWGARRPFAERDDWRERTRRPESRLVPTVEAKTVAIAMLALVVPLQLLASLRDARPRRRGRHLDGDPHGGCATVGMVMFNSRTWEDVTGWVGVLLADLAPYAALAALLEGVSNETVLPMGRRQRGRLAVEGRLTEQVVDLTDEPGVQQQLSLRAT